MYQSSTQGIIILIIGISLMLLFFLIFIVNIVYRYQQKQMLHVKEIESLKSVYQNISMQSQLEIQEQTLQNIASEIHDNIGQKLTLAKLFLNTLPNSEGDNTIKQVADSVNLITDAINDLSNLSHSMNNEIILNYGLIKALENEADQLNKSGIFQVKFTTTGNPVFMQSNTELLIFRIAQESLNNIIKYSRATVIDILLHYNCHYFSLIIQDNGIGFNTKENHMGTGILNMKKRANLMNGDITINSIIDLGTTIKLELPLNRIHESD